MLSVCCMCVWGGGDDCCAWFVFRMGARHVVCFELAVKCASGAQLCLFSLVPFRSGRKLSSLSSNLPRLPLSPAAGCFCRESHPNTACALTDLAAVQREQSKFEEAETNAQRAVASLRRGVGAKDVSTATALYVAPCGVLGACNTPAYRR